MPNDQDLNRFFAEADQGFLDLYKKENLSVDDITGRTWMERYTIAFELWAKCDKQAQKALAGDQHEAVRIVASTQLDDQKKQNWTVWDLISTGGADANQAPV